ncbi:GNAT family N-acetyltransferase (plasmid) [Mesorhizobium mediterraneum]|uniref:Acyl-homoserine-lactone synthase n=2 Tax=Mesorhizobium TaxID=68287 RepID=A0AB36RHE0_9HYPH|nr:MULTISPECIES: acyl-homoserine-lactone synthase TraI [Mesorhizobium]PAQ04285.1 autoinducer synthesis protein [Mesorhizobium mediterraneum]RUU73801.1 GNAT family N-acetyltransferase [Mesorhizobium sp. M7A.F.Ca.MR.362.00.0.0]RUU84776.1 GNAT family N-acetyltransferase [Mesorhizobium sp. M7A.F.Ca.MR.176.00.0.0]RWA99570.1 MAG: GNAT family N-acetyltransferase [Mesorhizobium sp.]RWB09435.1 MAG: GNAT family N-acetyltransferase [Mesorhizobium sp.]
MRILTVSPDLYGRHQNFLKQMYRLRAAVFGGRLEWDVSVTAGEERDRYDDFKPTYVLAVNEPGMVAGCARLLPASGPTMLKYIFPELLEKGSLNPHPEMVESSRFCVDTSQTAGREGGQLHLVTRTLFAGIIEWSMANGYSEIVTATDLRFERILKRAGWPMRRLGEPAAIGDTMAVAGSLPADRERFEQVCPPGYRSIISDGAPIRSAA